LPHINQRERVVIIDPVGTYYLSPLLQFSEAKDLHIQQAELATMAFLERNPKDFDNADLFKMLFLKPALAKAQDERRVFPVPTGEVLILWGVHPIVRRIQMRQFSEWINV
jgi:hypothetical protein